MKDKILCSTKSPIFNLEGVVDDWNNLSPRELKYRDELIANGIKECRNLLGKQKTKNMYFFYDGSLDGFEECKDLTKIQAYETRIQELHQEEIREISCSILKDRRLREEMKIYDPEERTDEDEVWKIKGRRMQIEFVYGRLKAFKVLCSMKKKSEIDF